MLLNALHYSHALLKQLINEGDTVVDATMGNGHDTLLLSQLVGTHGKVYSFDIQQAAITATQQKLKQNQQLDNTILIHDSHSRIQHYVKHDIKLAIFNLGYLPKGDHQITTTFNTTQQALEQLFPLLLPQGVIILVVYSGHDHGLESQALFEYAQQLDQQLYNVLHYRFINQRNTPPQVIVIEKKEVKNGTKH